VGSSAETLTITSTNTGVLAHTDEVATNRVCAHFAGDVSFANTTHTYQSVATEAFIRSDRRAKHDIQPLQSDLIRNLQPVSYKLNETDRESVGFIAQNVEELDPRLVNKDGSGMLALDYRAISVHNVHAVKQLLSNYEALKAELEGLKEKVDTAKLPIAIPAVFIASVPVSEGIKTNK